MSTQKRFDWTPEKPGDWVQVTFDLAASQVDGGKSAERIGFGIALHDFNDNSSVAGGNLLIDGNPAGGAVVYIDYPGDDSRSSGKIGAAAYAPGRNYGVRVTNLDHQAFQLEQLVDGVVDGSPLKLKREDLPDGAFGFEYCCGRSFIVDSVAVERLAAEQASQYQPFAKELAERRTRLEKAVAAPSNKRIISRVELPSPSMPCIRRSMPRCSIEATTNLRHRPFPPPGWRFCPRATFHLLFRKTLVPIRTVVDSPLPTG